MLGEKYMAKKETQEADWVISDHSESNILDQWLEIRVMVDGTYHIHLSTVTQVKGQYYDNVIFDELDFKTWDEVKNFFKDCPPMERHKRKPELEMRNAGREVPPKEKSDEVLPTNRLHSKG